MNLGKREHTALQHLLEVKLKGIPQEGENSEKEGAGYEKPSWGIKLMKLEIYINRYWLSKAITINTIKY